MNTSRCSGFAARTTSVISVVTTSRAATRSSMGEDRSSNISSSFPDFSNFASMGSSRIDHDGERRAVRKGRPAGFVAPSRVERRRAPVVLSNRRGAAPRPCGVAARAARVLRVAFPPGDVSLVARAGF